MQNRRDWTGSSNGAEWRGTARVEGILISGDEKEQIRRSIMRAFDTFYHQYYRNLFAGTPDKAGTGAAAIEDRFLLVRACDIGSHMRVLDRRTRSRPAMRHRTVLVKAAIHSMARGGFEMSELGDGPDGGARGYTDRHRQRLIHERYGDAFLGSEAGREPGDGRVKRLSTVFSESRLPRSRDADRARALLDAAGVATYVLHKSDTHRRAGLNSFLRLAFPQFLSDMLGFREECRAVFESLGERNERIDFLREQIVEGSGLLDLFYSQLSSILDVAWFRTLPEGEQKPLLRPAPEARYGPEDARRAGTMLSGIYGRGPALHLLDVCGKAFLQFGRPQAAALVFMQCTGMAEDDMQRGTEWQNVAATYRISQKFQARARRDEKGAPPLQGGRGSLQGMQRPTVDGGVPVAPGVPGSRLEVVQGDGEPQHGYEREREVEDPVLPGNDVRAPGRYVAAPKIPCEGA